MRVDTMAASNRSGVRAVPYRALLAVIGLSLLAACAGPSQSSPPQTNPQPGDSRPQGPVKRITAAVLSTPWTLSAMVNSAGGNTMPGVNELEQLLNAGLVSAG